MSGSSSGSDERTIRKLPLDELHPHEQTIPENLETIKTKIESSGKLELPILVDAETLVILDGHHRWAALRELGARQITAMTIDYFDDGGIELAPGPNCPAENLTHKDVIDRGLSEKVFPPKSTRHRVLFPYPTVNTPLDKLIEDTNDPA